MHKILFTKFNELFLIDSQVTDGKLIVSLAVVRPPLAKSYELRSDPTTPIGTVYIDSDLGKITQESVVYSLELDFEQY